MTLGFAIFNRLNYCLSYGSSGTPTPTSSKEIPCLNKFSHKRLIFENL